MPRTEATTDRVAARRRSCRPGRPGAVKEADLARTASRWPGAVRHDTPAVQPRSRKAGRTAKVNRRPGVSGRRGKARRRAVDRSRNSRRVRIAVRVDIRLSGTPLNDAVTATLEGSGRGLEAAAKALVRRTAPERLATLVAGMAHKVRAAILMYLLGGPATHKALVARTGLDGGPLYHHLRELRSAGLIGPKQRDVYDLTRQGRRAILTGLVLERTVR